MYNGLKYSNSQAQVTATKSDATEHGIWSESTLFSACPAVLMLTNR